MVITPKLDRMFRSALDALDVLADLKKRGIALHMIDLGGDVSTNGVSKLVFTILSAVAEAERDRTRERVTEVKRDQRTRGRYLGGKPPFGWCVGEAGGSSPVPEQQEALRRMRALRTEGTPLRAIADRMTAEGTPISSRGAEAVHGGRSANRCTRILCSALNGVTCRFVQNCALKPDWSL